MCYISLWWSCIKATAIECFCVVHYWASGCVCKGFFLAFSLGEGEVPSLVWCMNQLIPSFFLFRPLGRDCPTQRFCILNGCQEVNFESFRKEGKQRLPSLRGAWRKALASLLCLLMRWAGQSTTLSFPWGDPGKIAGAKMPFHRWQACLLKLLVLQKF